MKQIGTTEIGDSSITSSKPAENFMKRVTLFDEPAGNALGWDPDGVKTSFIIFDPDVTNSIETFVSALVPRSPPATFGCEVTFIFNQPTPNRFSVVCETAPGENAELQYMVTNLPAHINEN